MTDGTSQGLFIVVAIVIFGIFVVLAYILFEDTLSPAMASMFSEATEEAAKRSNPFRISDPRLESAIKSSIGVEQDYELTEEDMLLLTVLRAENKEIESLKGLEYAKNLSILDVYGNNIKSIRPIKDLEKITYYRLSSNVIQDVHLLKGGEHVEELHLSRNRSINNMDMEILKNMPNLKVLWLDYTDVSDISMTIHTPKLEKLILTSTKVSNIETVKHMTDLTELSINKTNVSDISPIKDLFNLRILRLTGSPIEDYTYADNLILTTYIE